MNYNRLGFDFSNLQSCTLFKKNRMFSMVFIIISVTFLFISSTFLWLYLSDATINVSGVPMSADEPGYDKFFYIFLGVFFGITLLFIIISVLTLTTKPKPYLYMDSDDFNSETFYYITRYGRNNEVYLTDNFAITYTNFTKSVKIEKNHLEVKKLHEKLIPWQGLLNHKTLEVNQKEKATIVKVKYPNSYLTRVYKFSNNISIVPIDFTVSDVYITTMSRKTTGFAKYHFDLINRSQQFEIHPEIKKALHNLRQTM